MKITTYETLQAALQEAKNLPYAYLKHLSQVYLGWNSQPVSTDELLAARFFGESCEIRLYDDGQGLAAVKFSDEAEDHVIDTWVNIEKRFGVQLQKRQYLSFDPDGQAYIACTRLLGWKED